MNMRSLTAAARFVALLVLSVTRLSLATCTSPSMRMEWRMLTEEQRLAFIAAVRKLKQRPAGPNDTANMASWNYDQFVELHYDNVPNAHAGPTFLPWHRIFISGFESALQSIDASITLPFWDWSLDSQQPSAASVFSPQYFGGNGRDSDHCVMEGVASGWTISVPGDQKRSFANCLTRCFNFTAMYPPEALAALITQSTDYEQFRSGFEANAHAAVHNQIGGLCGDMGQMFSPNDPIFFLHHAMVDRVWWRWQITCGANQFLFTGDTNTMLIPFNIPASSVMSTVTGSPYCYIYSTSAGDAPLSLNCPNGPSPDLQFLTNSTQKNSGNTLFNSISSIVPGMGSTGNPILGLVSTNPSATGAGQNTLQRRDVATDPRNDGSDACTEPCGSDRPSRAWTWLANMTNPIYGPNYIPYVPGSSSQTTPTNLNVVAPSWNNQSDTDHLRYPPPACEVWIKKNNINATVARSYDTMYKNVVDYYNNLDGYVSPAALKHAGWYDSPEPWQLLNGSV